MLRNAHERERKLNKEVDELKESSKLKCALMDSTLKENEEFKKKFHFVKNKLEAGLKETHETKRLSHSKDERIQELEADLTACKEEVNQIKNCDDLEMAVKVKDDELHEQAELMKLLVEDKELLKKRYDDIADELETKIQKIRDIEDQEQSKSLKSSQGSLSEELQNSKIIACEDCCSTFLTLKELKEHKKGFHKQKLEMKLSLMKKINDLNSKIKEEKTDLTSKLLKLKDKEMEASLTCSCIGFCKITHLKHNFVKSWSKEYFSKMEHIVVSNSNEARSNLSGIRKRFICKQCDDEFSRQGELKKHVKSEHEEREEKIGEVIVNNS